jgi:amino acid adenylation domain-containing protein
MSSTETLDRQKMLAAARQELLRRRLEGAAAPAADPNAIRPRGGDGPAPLSFAQQRLWVLHQINPRDTSYNEIAPFRVVGALDVPALERAVREVLRRHEVLRSAFAQEDGDAVQRVADLPAPALVPEDLAGLDAGAREAALRERMRREMRAPYDLARGPLLRASLLRMAEQEHVLLIGLHHAVTDGWTRGVLLRELRTLYGAFARGEASPLPPLPVQYGDFAAWQRQRLEGEALRQRLEWWKQHLAGAPAVLDLPADHPRPAAQSFRGGYRTLRLPMERLEALRALGREEGGTLFMVLMSAFQVLLARWSGQHDLVVGTPVAGRERQEVEGLMGCFVNTLALRGDLSGDPPFRELLRRTREASVAAFARQDVPFERVVEELRPERTTAHSPIFQAMFTLQVAPGPAANPDGLIIRPMAFDRTTAKFDVLLDAFEGETGLILGLEYATDLFEASTAARMLSHLDTLLAGAAADPGTRISALPLLDDEDRARLAAWNATERAYPPADGLHRAFEAQALRTPDAVALVAEEGTLTYAQLDARANRIARRLAALGVGRGARVGVCLERGAGMVASLLAVMKAGAAYVPLDPGYPAARLEGMLEDADVGALVTESRLADRLPAHGAAVLALDADAATIDAESAAPVDVDADPDLPVYVIFTSGSTGRPKGAANAHRGVLNRLFWMQEAYGLTADDVVLQKTPFSFDVSVWEFFWPLMTGARLVVARPEGHRDPAYLAGLIEREGVTTVHFVPSMLAAFLDAAGAARCGSLRRVVCSGEALSAELVARFHARMPPSAELHNLYGPTEAAVDVTYHPCSRGDARRTVPIGRPVANTQVHVLEPSGEPAPVGVPGELHIGGVQVGLGYLGRPALTSERFVPDPFGGPGARLYRTGDRARWTAEGVVEYLGRLDFQVKVRGLRIELGEIEAALVAHPSVREAVAAVRAAPAGDPLLVAYVVADGGGADAEALREHLGRSLPEYMVPSAFVTLDALPLSPNGKLDRRALPDPDFAARTRPYVAPRSPVERVVAGIWAELLKAERVGVDDDFFALGGHSLLAVQAAARAQDAFGVEIPLGYVFSQPTVAGLSAALSADPATGSRVEQVAALLEMLSGVSEDDAQAMLSHHSPPQEPVR